MIDLTDVLQKKLGSLGHHLAAFDKALRILQRRLLEEVLPQSWMDHFGVHFIRSSTDELPDRLLVGLASGEPSQLSDWVIEVPHAPWLISTEARAALHLPAARGIWQKLLRRSVFDDLLRRLPRAWIVDLSPLPPSSAIAGLGISSWAHLPRLKSSGQTFRLSFTDSDSLLLGPGSELDLWNAGAIRLLEEGSQGASVSLIPQTKPTIFAHYENHQGRWEMTGAKLS